MAKRKRRRTRRTKSSGMTAAPRRRWRRHHLATSPRRRRHRRGLSELNLVKGKQGMYLNPIIEGAMGGVATQLMVKVVPETLFTSNPSIKPYENWIKGGLLLLGAAVAAHMKQPLVAAGMAGGAAILTMQKEGILQEEAPHGGFSAGRFRQGRFANPRVLMDGALLSDGHLLSEAVYDINPPYDPLYESPKHEFRF